jgi:hypothetical protein
VLVDLGSEGTLQVLEFSRAEFLAERWHYKPGQHVAILAPTDGGKTHLMMQLLAVTATPELPAVLLEVKPRDSTMRSFMRANNYRMVREWPPTPSIWQPRKPPGWVVWPRHQFDPEVDDYNLWKIHRRAILSSYKKGRRIIAGDEAAGLKELGLEREINTVQQRGRSMGAGGWWASQRPYHIPLSIYSQAEHLFLGNDPDKRSRDRYSEIGGIDPRIVAQITMRLEKWHFLYIRRTGRVLCIVGP